MFIFTFEFSRYFFDRAIVKSGVFCKSTGFLKTLGNNLDLVLRKDITCIKIILNFVDILSSKTKNDYDSKFFLYWLVQFRSCFVTIWLTFMKK